MPSFDTVSVVDKVELANSLDQANKEIANRFDFKGSDSRIESKELEITLFADDDFKLGQVKDVLVGKMSKRGIDVRVLEEGKTEKVSGNKMKEIIKIKIQASIQGDVVRVTGTKRDDLQEVMQLLKKEITEQPLQFENFRD